MEALRWLRAAFWSEKFWWTEGTGWQSLNAPGYPDFRDMNYLPFALAVILLFARLIFERRIARPLGVWLGVPDANVGAHSAIHWIRSLLTGKSQIAGSVVARSRMEKFCESSWRFAYYFSVWCYGWWALYDKPYLANQDECWKNWPFQTVPWEIRWYYLIQSGFYWSLLISAVFDVKRKDFWMLLVHHIATLALLWFSWLTNFVRIGALILLLHDAVDIVLEVGKMFRYAEKRAICNILAVVFAVTWVVTRLYIFPARLVYSTLITGPSLIQQVPLSYYLFNGLLLLLQLLHIVWSFMIVQSLWIGWKGGMADDARSDDESGDDERTKKAR